METDREPTLWELLNPVWMFRCRPADFRGWAGDSSICPGVFWVPGMAALLSLHMATSLGCWFLWRSHGSWAFLSLVPLGVLWAWFVTADVKFRRQGPTRQQRWGFDNAVINWFGLASTLAFYFAILPTGLLVLLWWALA